MLFIQLTITFLVTYVSSAGIAQGIVSTNGGNGLEDDGTFVRHGKTQNNVAGGARLTDFLMDNAEIASLF
jgi:hypothetical protein